MATDDFTYDLSGRKFSFETGLFRTQGDGTVVARLGDTLVMAVASMSEKPKENADFFPMVVDYEERYYAAGKIKGSRFVKREGRPSEKAILNSRMIDRPIRPLFPEGMTHDVQVICPVFSVDLEVDPSTMAITAASAALLIAGIPFQGPLAAVRIGLITDADGAEQLIVNPTYEQCAKGKLDLVVAGTEHAITMVEAGAKEVSEERMLEALELAHKQIKKLCALQKEFVKAHKKKDQPYELVKAKEEITSALESFVTDAMMDSVRGTKIEFHEKFHVLEEKVKEQFKAEIEAETFSEKELEETLNLMLEGRMRENVLEKDFRLDGRKLDEVRPISCKVGVLPRTHGTGLFTRGETQVMSVCTLGAPGAAQVLDTMDEDTEKRYIHHYNFPPYSVGDIKPLRGPSRREIGHGNLAERALLAVLPSQEEFPYTIWVVSETLSCNGSSSMGSVCGSTLALMDAGVPIKKPVAGIAMGLITDGKKYKILSDIQGLEDFGGDMDFKVAGTADGITALQMDIKVSGVPAEIMHSALTQAKKNRLHILDEMAKAIAAPRKELSKYAPLITTIRIDPEQIKDVIGRGGETIQKITRECGVEIDIEQEGLVFVTAPNQESGKKAVDWINKLTYVPKVGDVFEGKVTRVIEIGAFVEFVPGKEGLVHISQLDHQRVGKVTDVAKVGDMMKVKLMEIDDQGRLNFSRKALLPRPPHDEHSPKVGPHRPFSPHRT